MADEQLLGEMNNYWVTNFNADQMGGMQWSYFITSSADNSLEYATKFAWQNRIPFLTRVLPSDAKTSDNRTFPESILAINPGNVLLINMKPIKGENAALLQLRETSGKETELSISSPHIPIKKVTVCDVTGEALSGNPSPTLRPWESKFIKISW